MKSVSGGETVADAAAYCANKHGLPEHQHPLMAKRGDLVVVSNDDTLIDGKVYLLVVCGVQRIGGAAAGEGERPLGLYALGSSSIHNRLNAGDRLCPQHGKDGHRFGAKEAE